MVLRQARSLWQSLEKEYIDSISEIFESHGAKTNFVELYADQKTRIERNKSELRLEHKKSKRDIEWSHNNLVNMDTRYRLNTEGEFYYPDKHLRIDNTDLSANECAKKIQAHFSL